MDSANLSATIIRELGDRFVAALTQAGPELLRADLDGIEQHLQDLSRRVLGAVVEAVVSTLAAAETEPPVCATCHQPLHLVDHQRPRQLQGLVGDDTLRRAYFGCRRCHQGQAPLAEHLGLGHGALSPGLARVACRLGLEDSFGETADARAETLRVDVPREAIRRITEGIGQVAEAEEQAAVRRAQAGQEPLAPTDPLPTGATLLVEVDGTLVHREEDWHEGKGGLAAPLGPTLRTDPDTGRATLVMGRPSDCASFETAETFWYRVYGTACRQGLGGAGLAVLVVLADGAEWIGHDAARFLAIGPIEISRLSTSIMPGNTWGSSQSPSLAKAPPPPRSGSSHSRRTSSPKGSARSSLPWAPSRQPTREPPRKSAKRWAMSPPTPHAWITHDSSPATSRLAQEQSKAPAKR